MASEKLLEKKGCNAVRDTGGQAIKLLAVNFTGLPDRMMLMKRGRIAFVEFKSTGETLSPRQEQVRKILTDLGFEYWIIDTNESLQAFIAEI